MSIHQTTAAQHPDQPASGQAPAPGSALAADLITAHLAASPHRGTGRGEALDHLLVIITRTAEDLDDTAEELHCTAARARDRLEAAATGRALSTADQPVMAATGAELDLLGAVARTQTRHLRQLLHTYRKLNTPPPEAS
ncbi:hypothetical protein [Kitasatospora arboriphila]|uniref:Restriction endonuclease n=1 Tax=Kitasatospora arboriphila TaxID=258052 RepID=A0ABP4E0J0_9ACTN